jgi:hypothetical protein
MEVTESGWSIFCSMRAEGWATRSLPLILHPLSLDAAKFILMSISETYLHSPTGSFFYAIAPFVSGHGGAAA